LVKVNFGGIKMDSDISYNKEPKKGTCRELSSTINISSARHSRIVIDALVTRGFDVDVEYTPINDHDAKVELKVFDISR
jgi:hypothetical protein